MRQLVDLSDKLEEQFCEETPYVIWGVLSDVPLVESLALKLEERTFGFIPNWSMRTESVFASNNESRELMRLLSREWADEPGRDRVKHKSGLVFEFVCIGGDSSSSAPLFVPRVRAEDGDHLLQESTVYQMCASALSPFAFRVFVANSDWPIASVCDHRAIDYRGPARLSSAR
ncbi:MAG: hypothetical protein GWM88_15315 [Pseudomonadales bacterium]|nr:hypothetical protein [Pseudomonadales bacterium]NIX09307.1 hypothetical protein [Pseudomonadales bacterium]